MWPRGTQILAGLAIPLISCADPPSQGTTPVNAIPHAAFTSSCTGQSCTFADESTDADGAVTARHWSFGDGLASTEMSPTHSYPDSGTYTVSLTVVDDHGAADSLSRQITVVAAPASDIIFIGAGDIAHCSYKEDSASAAVIAQYPTATVYTVGDNAYPDGSPVNFSECYEPTWGKFKDRTRPAPGNHEYHTNGASGYFAYFGDQAGPAGRGYYSYDLGSWHIISLNSEIDASANSAQSTWLKADLANHPAACTLAYWHKPLFTSGAQHAPELAMQPLFAILYDAGAEILLSGHNHQYERFGPQRPDGTPDEISGIREFVVGSGGAPLYDFSTPEPNSEVRHKGHGVLKLTLKASSYSWEFVPITRGTFTDVGNGVCH